MNERDIDVPDSRVAYYNFLGQCQHIEKYKDLLPLYLDPLRDTIINHLGFQNEETFLRMVEDFTGEAMLQQASFIAACSQRRLGLNATTAIIFFLYKRHYSFYFNRPECKKPGKFGGKINQCINKGLWEVFPEFCNLPRTPVTKAATLAASAASEPPEPVNLELRCGVDRLGSISTFLEKLEHRRLIWQLEREPHNSVDREAFGLNIGDAQPPLVGEAVTLLLDITADASYLFPNCSFSFGAVRLRANIASPDLAIFEYSKDYNALTPVGQGVRAQILGGGSDSYVAFVSEDGALHGRYELKGDWFLKLKPASVEFSFNAELYAESAKVEIINTDRNEELSRTKQAIIACLISKGLGKKRGSAFVTLATQSFTIRPGQRF